VGALYCILDFSFSTRFLYITIRPEERKKGSRTFWEEKDESIMFWTARDASRNFQHDLAASGMFENVLDRHAEIVARVCVSINNKFLALRRLYKLLKLF
jgi:hypothetical protein